MDERKRLVFISAIVVFMVILVIALLKNNDDYLTKLNKEAEVTKKPKTHQITNENNQRLSTKSNKTLENKEYEELIKNFITALTFIDKDPKVLDEFVEKDSTYYKTLITNKEYIGKSIDSIFIESVRINNGIHLVKTKITINSNAQMTVFQIKPVNRKYKFIGSE